MTRFLKLSALAATFALVGVSAQAQSLDNAQAEIGGPAITPIVLSSKAPVAASATGLSRAEVQAELVRARAAGELDFAYAEVNGSLPRATVNSGELRLAARQK